MSAVPKKAYYCQCQSNSVVKSHPIVQEKQKMRKKMSSNELEAKTSPSSIGYVKDPAPVCVIVS